MGTIDEINRANLKALATELGGVGELATTIERSYSQVSQWINASPDSKTGKPRGIRPATCRYIEEKCGKQRGWMDVDHSNISEKLSSPQPVVTISEDQVSLDEVLELINAYKVASPKERTAIMSLAKTAAKRAVARHSGTIADNEG